MKRFRFVFALIALFQVSLLAQHPVSIDTTLMMNDGVIIDALYAFPTSPPPAKGYPAMVAVHGFSGSKEVHRGGAEFYASNGYVVVAYSVRGQGMSEGEFDFFNSDRQNEDLKAMIDFTKSLPQVNPERIGVYGGSQGGLHAWSAALNNFGVRAVLMFVANGRFEENWIQNNAMNCSFAGLRRTNDARFARETDSVLEKAARTRELSEFEALLNKHSTRGREGENSVPVLMLFSWHDQVFNPTAGLRHFKELRSPKRAIVFPGPHGSSTIPEVNDFMYAQWDAWFAYWLKDETKYSWIARNDSNLVLIDGGTADLHYFSEADTSIWLDVSESDSRVLIDTLYLSSNELVKIPGLTEEQLDFSYVTGNGSQDLIFRSEPLPADLTLCSASSTAELVVKATGFKYQTSIELFDWNPGTDACIPISRGHFQKQINPVYNVDTIAFRFNAMMHTLSAGHRIEARLSGGKPDVTNPVMNIVIGPGISSTNALFTGNGNDSRLRLFCYKKPVSAADIIPMAAEPTLNPAYPNPFGMGSPTGTCAASLTFTTTTEAATLRVYDRLGILVAILHDSGKPAGSYTCNFSGYSLPSGVYFAVLRNGSVCRVEPLILSR